MAKAYIPKDIFGNPIPEDALLDEIRSRHEGRPPPQSETQRRVSELDLSAPVPELLSAEELGMYRREQFDADTQAHAREAARGNPEGKRKRNFNVAVINAIDNGFAGAREFENNPDALAVTEKIVGDVALDAGKALSTVTSPVHKKYKGWKRDLKAARDNFYNRLQDKFGLSPNTSEGKKI